MACIEVEHLTAFSSLSTVSVECSYLMLRVIAKRALFYPDELVHPNELFLGTGCVVTFIRPDEFEFYYSVRLCGIVIEVREGAVLPVPSVKCCFLFLP